jgi:hypothetical protein
MWEGHRTHKYEVARAGKELEKEYRRPDVVRYLTIQKAKGGGSWFTAGLGKS